MTRFGFLWLVGALTLSFISTGAWAGSPHVTTPTYGTNDVEHLMIDRTSAHIVTRDSPARVEAREVERVPVSPVRSRYPHIVYRPVFETAATIDRELAMQPVHPHLIEVSVGHTTITLDPHQNLRRPTGGIDENHSLMRAQRQWLDRQAKPARVLRRPEALAQTDEDHGVIRPSAIIPVPIEHQPPSSPAPSLVRGE